MENSRNNKYIELKTAIDNADAIVIGAGAGLSTSAGFYYSGERFQENFADFEEKYDFHDMYSGGFFPFKTVEEHWAYWSRFIYLNRYQEPPKPLYSNLFECVKDKDYFVITTNVDHCFQKAGFDKKRLFYTQGDYGLFQCSVPCHQKTYDNKEIIEQMVEKQAQQKIPTALIPICPLCGKKMTMNLRSDDKFVQDEGWYEAAQAYQNFLEENKDTKVLYLELGVGYNTPSIIKYPFWQKTFNNPKAIFACINQGDATCPKEIADRSICINQDISNVIDFLHK